MVEGSTLHGSTQTLMLTYTDKHSGVAPNTLRLSFNGQDLSSQLTVGDGEAQGTVTLAAGPIELVARVQDKAGNEAEATLHVTVEPELEEVATPLDETVVVPFVEATDFLYTGPNAVQKGVAPGTIDAKRAAVLRGLVKGREGSPLAGVKVSILGHSEYGYTLTRANGMFDMAVNGGGLLTVQYEKEGFLPSQRQEQPTWQDYAWLGDVVLVGVDAQVTTVQFDGSRTGIQVAQGAPVTDADGTRRATLLFPPNTQVSMELPDGSTRTLSTAHVRATEYTVGERGPDAMPGALPPTSGYTYAVELSVDEAQAAGAVEVRFTQPVPLYVDNFLDFPVGSIVPAGYYDRRDGVWKPSENGRVIKLLRVNDGVATLDVTGDGVSDGPGVLGPLGITGGELQQLGSLYPAGRSLWRTPIVHFTPWDCNWPYGPPADVGAPNPPPPQALKPEERPECTEGSVIECQNQVLGESMGLTGTPYSLHYRSDRVPGRKTAYRLDIPLSGDVLPSSLKQIALEIEIAGQRFEHAFPASPNKRYVFDWDGKDAYGRTLQGEWPVRVRVGYVYPLVYQQPAEFGQAFGRISGVPFTASRQTREMTLWQEWEGALGAFRVSSQGLGGWTLSVHHSYDSGGRVLHLGNGQRRSAQELNHQIITTIAGSGIEGDGGDGGPATQAEFLLPMGITVGRDGSIFVADAGNARIRKISPEGIVTTVAGTGVQGYNGDGMLATHAQLQSPLDVAVGMDGSLFIADAGNNRIRKVGPDGFITTVAGAGDSGDDRDGVPATQARLYSPNGVVLGSDGTFYIADDSRVRQVGHDGVITTIAGTMSGIGYSGDGGPATQAMVYVPQKLRVGPDGSLFIADMGNDCIRKVSPGGIITTAAGRCGEIGYSGDGGPATQARLSGPRAIALDSDGSLWIADSGNGRIRKVSPNGVIRTVAGLGDFAYGGDGGPALLARFRLPHGLALAPDGSLLVSDWGNDRIRRIAYSMPGFTLGELVIPSADGGEVYVFNGRGLHLRTLDAVTKALRYEFGYDSAGQLILVKDEDGRITRVERDTMGRPMAIVAPHGQRTNLTLDSGGYLSSITNPASEKVELTHTHDGLLSSLKDARGGLHVFEYEVDGRLKKDSQPGGGFKALARTDSANGYSVAVSTALGRTTKYQVQNLSTGVQQRTTTEPSGEMSVQVRSPDGTTTLTAADGTVITTVEGPDARFGMQAPLVVSQTVQLPSGLTHTLSQSRTAVLANPQDVLSLVSLTNTLTVNGFASTSTYDASTRKLIEQSPLGKEKATTYDEKGRVVKVAVPGVLPVQYGYDTEGRLALVTQGTRSSTFTYEPGGYLGSVKDALSRTASFSYDLAGRVKIQTLPGSRQVGLEYDANGNVKTVTPPGKPSHGFTYTSDDLEEDYVPPSLTGGLRVYTHSEYNPDRQLTLMSYPDGASLHVNYEDMPTQKRGRFLSATLTPLSGGRYAALSQQATYYAGSGYLQSLTDSRGAGLHFEYDGPLLTQVKWSGDMSGIVSYSYDSFLRVASVSVNGADVVTYTYDDDGLLQQVGGLVFARDSSNGLLTGTSMGQVSTLLSYNAYGEVETRSAAVGATPLYTIQLRRDDLGRISQKTETIEGVTHTYVYTYDTAGRLESVKEDGSLVVQATYDNGGPGNGNRTLLSQGGMIRTASYDEQDRLLSFGGTTYAYGPNGDLQSRLVGGQVTTYVYDAWGNLLSAALPSGMQIAYVVDPSNRRVGKKVNGTIVQGFLYDGGLRVIAELDGNGQVVSRFVYATQGYSPDFMVKGGVTYRILSDERGSPRLIVNMSDGRVTQRLDYDSWGNVLSDSNPGFQPFGFAGGLYDKDTKLTRFGARDYDAESGRWIAKDPIRFEGGDTNLYVYVENDPLNLIDPRGLSSAQCREGFLECFWDCFLELPNPVVAAGSIVPLVNLKMPSEWREGASRWTTIDRRLPPWMKPNTKVGATVTRAGRTKFVGRYGTMAVAVGIFSLGYSLGAAGACGLECNSK